jgi:IclR family transcriptional regulator, KDG regulon repressor
MSRDRVQVIERATDILDILIEGSATLTEIVARTGLPKGTAFRILSSLSYGDRVVKDPLTARYMLGPGTWRLVQAAVDAQGSLGLIARTALTGLWRSSAETITLNIRMGLERVCIEEMRSPLPLLHTAGVGSRIPLHVGASGKVILAFTAAEQRERILDCLSFDRLTSSTVTDRAALERELEAVRQRGWAVSMGERIPGAVGMSVPLRGSADLVMSLSLLGPAERLTADRRDDLIAEMQEAARAVESRLKGVEAPPVPAR